MAKMLSNSRIARNLWGEFSPSTIRGKEKREWLSEYFDELQSQEWLNEDQYMEDMRRLLYP